VVVANDDGGGIFSVLEQGAPPHAAAFERVFGTPHGTDLAALCRAHGVGHDRLGPGAPDLVAALAPRGAGTRVLEVPVDRAGRREAHRRAGAAAVAVLSGRTPTPGSAPGA
jgi:2-succinyl-5-enolpyruvyl-6-hydroxy-3-cyclohexene-1-carboxylate synthase